MTYALLLLFGLSVKTFAQTIPLRAVTDDEFEVLTREFSASAAFSSVGGAATLGQPFGFELGILGGLTNSPGVHRVSREADARANVKQLPTAAIYGALSVPLGVTFEVGVMPRVGADDYRFENFGAAVKWTPTDLFFNLPLDLALRAQLTKTSLRFNAWVDGSRTEAAFDGVSDGFEVIASKNFGILTPFVSVGGADARATLVGSNAFVFDQLVTTTASARTRTVGPTYRLGLEMHLLLVSLAAEYDRVLGADRFNLKLTAGF